MLSKEVLAEMRRRVALVKGNIVSAEPDTKLILEVAEKAIDAYVILENNYNALHDEIISLKKK